MPYSNYKNFIKILTFDDFFCILYMDFNHERVIFDKEGILMEYTKPTVIAAEKVDLAKCGDGPCGRPCGQRA